MGGVFEEWGWRMVGQGIVFGWGFRVEIGDWKVWGLGSKVDVENLRVWVDSESWGRGIWVKG